MSTRDRDREPDRAPELDKSSVLHQPRARAADSPAARVLALQQTIGNRAVSELIGEGAAPGSGAQRLARKPIQIKKARQEKGVAGKPNVGWTAKFQVEFVGNECVLTVKPRLKPNPDVTKAEADQVKTDATAAFKRFWDEKFYFDDTKTKDRFFLRVNVEWVTKNEHVTIKLIKGHGAANMTTWYTQEPPETSAHELSHTIGMFDEYIDPNVVNRKTGTSAGVFQDHSLMGNYFVEGIGVPEIKLRHGQMLADLIGKATKRKLTVGYTGTYQGERLVRWRGIRDTAKTGGNATAEAAANTEISAIESDMMIPALTQ